MLELKNIEKSFLVEDKELKILSDISLKIDQGEKVALIGPSGSGKSTLLSIMAGLDQATNGEVIIDGVYLNKMDENSLSDFRNQKIGFIFQSFELIPSFTAFENISFPAEISTNYQKIKVIELLNYIGLENRKDHFPYQLSGGEKQRIAIARAFINDPEIIFADEPTGNLDSKTGEHILNLLLDFSSRKGKTLIMITHDQSIAQKMDRIIKIKDGKIE